MYILNIRNIFDANKYYMRAYSNPPFKRVPNGAPVICKLNSKPLAFRVNKYTIEMYI